MIRIVTDKAMDEWLARHREALAIQIADAVEAMPTEDCDHRSNRPACAKCAERRTVLAAAYVVRETGGVQ